MRAIGRTLLLIIVVTGLAGGIAYFLGGRQSGPRLEIRSPARLIGQSGTLELVAEAPGARFSDLRVVLEQEGLFETLFSLDAAGASGEIGNEAPDRLLISRPLGKKAVPSLKAGPARLTATASRPVFFGFRNVATVATQDLEVRLDPPRVAVVSLHHFVNHGGAEFVVYRVTPPEAVSGVRVAEAEYRGFPGSSSGLTDPELHVAFFALAHDQDLNSSISLFARDEGGNESTTPLDRRVFAKPFAKSRLELDQRFLERVVPAIAQNTPALDVSTSAPDALLARFLKINGDLRRQNTETIRAVAEKTRPEMLWTEAFSQLGSSAVQSRFADYRTYFYGGKEVDRQVHLGFDLASTAQAPVHASNRGIVVSAGFLGIYGNCVIIDHGLSVQSLYGHLSSMHVKAGDTIEKGQEIGRTGTTGLAGGDHLHFTMLVGGTAVNPIEWWDPHWLEDRVLRKLREAGAAIPQRTR
jgi:murein DD-endopeptidase MepM/ murein hydrolase activator NlpD